MSDPTQEPLPPKPEGQTPVFVVDFYLDEQGKLDVHANGNLKDMDLNQRFARALRDVADFICTPSDVKKH
jgi:hypothetical protein